MLKPSLTGWRSQYDRMCRSYQRVMAPHQSSVKYDDDLHHFMQDCWHLKDWIKNDIRSGVGISIEAEVDSSRSLRIAADLANGSKHLSRNWHREDANVVSVDVTVHLAQSRASDITYHIELGDGSRTTADVVVADAMRDWDDILKRIGLLP